MYLSISPFDLPFPGFARFACPPSPCSTKVDGRGHLRVRVSGDGCAVHEPEGGPPGDARHQPGDDLQYSAHLTPRRTLSRHQGKT